MNRIWCAKQDLRSLEEGQSPFVPGWRGSLILVHPFLPLIASGYFQEWLFWGLAQAYQVPQIRCENALRITAGPDCGWPDALGSCARQLISHVGIWMGSIGNRQESSSGRRNTDHPLANHLGRAFPWVKILFWQDSWPIFG